MTIQAVEKFSQSARVSRRATDQLTASQTYQILRQLARFGFIDRTHKQLAGGAWRHRKFGRDWLRASDGAHWPAPTAQLSAHIASWSAGRCRSRIEDL